MRTPGLIFGWFFLAVLFGLPLSLHAQAEDLVTEIFDIGPITIPQGRMEFHSFGPALGSTTSFFGDTDAIMPAGERVPPIPGDQLEEWLTVSLAEGTRVKARGNRLIVTGSQTELTRCSTILAEMKNRLGGVKLGITWFESKGSPFALNGGLLNAERTAALVEALGRGGELRLLATTELAISPGGRSSWKRIKKYSMLTSYEANVASKIASASPQMKFIPQGLQVRVHYCPMTDGRSGLFVEGWRAFGLSRRKLVLAMTKVPWVELATSDLSILTGSGAPQRGESLLFCDWSAGKNTFLLVKVIDAPQAGGSLSFAGPYFLSWHRAPAYILPPIPGTGHGENRREAWKMAGGDAGLPEAIFDPEAFTVFCREVKLSVEKVLPSGVLLVGTGWQEDRLQALEKRLSGPPGEQTVLVELQWKGMPRAEAGSLDSRALFKRGLLLRRLVVPVLKGRTASFLSGTEQQFVENYDDMIAEESCQSIPRISAYWSGTTGRISLSGESAWLDLEGHLLGEPQPVATGKSTCGVIERIVHEHSTRRCGIVRAPRLNILGDTVSPAADKNEKLRVVVACKVQ